jgi:hypothetical protein
MSFKENKINFFQDKSNVEHTKDKENVVKRIMSHPMFKKIALAFLLTVLVPSDIKKDNTNNEKGSDPIEAVNNNIDTVSKNDSTDSLKYELTDEEYKVNTATHYPSKGERIIIGPQSTKGSTLSKK